MSGQSNQLHILLFPLMAQGHMTPMVDIAKLFAQQGALVTIITTPENASRHSSILTRAINSGLQIQLHQLQFPFQSAGLPEGCENFDMLPSLSVGYKIFIAVNELEKPAEELFQKLNPKPCCIVSDFCIPWTAKLAKKWNIPRISFSGFCCFSMLCMHNIYNSNILETVKSENEYFVVPGMPQPHTIELTKSEVVGPVSADFEKFHRQVLEAEKESYGFIINTFEYLEQEFVKEYKKATARRVWCVGPVSLCNKDGLDKIVRGNKPAVDGNECLNWLDSWSCGSVVYACLGSIPNLTTLQLMELGLGLEASKRPFIWVIKGDFRSKEIEKWVSESGFEERTKGRSFFIFGWAPQVLILSHPAIGGFVTHCGWNSISEAIGSGVPMVTWPLFGDQFINEKLVVQVLEIGVSIGVKGPEKWGEEGKFGLLVKKDDIVRALDKLMAEGEEREERNKRVKKLADMANMAIEEGGSSSIDIKILIQDIMDKINH